VKTNFARKFVGSLLQITEAAAPSVEPAKVLAGAIDALDAVIFW